MRVDYDVIRKENRDRYGWDTAVLDLLGQLYSQRTHFLFELIQNAEDAGARELTFELFEDRLLVRHDGRPFTEADVRGICGVGKSTKTDDLTQIGKFGIGFKSVYAYTRTPEVHSAHEHFRIKSYVRPCETDQIELARNETRFIFPFDHAEVAPTKAMEEIAKALNDLELGTLLFLRNIQRIRVRGEAGAEGVLERVDEPRGPNSRHVVLSSSLDGTDECQEWFVWERPLDGLDQPPHRVEIAFSVTERENSYYLNGLEESPLVVFFPTAKETFLGFLIQGPYRTTPARDNIPEYDQWNRSLAAETAELLATVLRELRDQELLTVDVLQAMPLDPSRFQEGAMLRPLFEVARNAISNESLVPKAGGGYGAAKELKLARGTGLRDLLSGEQLQRLYGEMEPPAFAHESITPDRSGKLYDYLRRVIGVDEVTPEDVVERINPDFLEEQSDDWTARFYSFLRANPALCRPPRWQGDQPGLAISKPIVRLEDGSQVVPFDEGGRPRAYLPGPSPTDFPTVRRAVADNPVARQFLEAIKLTEPDVVAEVLENVLPRYEQIDVEHLDAPQHQADLELIARALSEATPERLQDLRTQLCGTAFVVGVNAGTGERRLCTPSSVYEHTDELHIYFDGNEEAWFVDDRYDGFLEQLREFGILTAPARQVRDPDELGYIRTVSGWGQHERGVDGFDPGARIFGLDYALRHPTDARSEYVWNFVLAPNRQLLAGIVEKSKRKDFSGVSRKDLRSPVGQAATEVAWLPGPDGTFHRPDELLLKDLPDRYKRDDVLARALGMEQPVVEELCKQLGLPPEVLRGLRAHPDLVTKLQQELAALSRGGGVDGSDEEFVQEPGIDDVEILDFATELSNAFARPGRPRRHNGEVAAGRVSGDVSNPERRRERVRETLEDDKGLEPSVDQRFQHVSRRVWEAKDSAVRHFLLEQYDGHCQVCSATFGKRDGTPYFEGVYLVSRVHGRWVDRPGNVLCLCASCSARFLHGPVEADDILDQVRSWRTRLEGGDTSFLRLRLCGDDVVLTFAEKHLLDLQEMVASRHE